MFYSLWVVIYLLSGVIYLVGFSRISLTSECTVRSRPHAPTQIVLNSFKIPKHTFPETKCALDFFLETKHHDFLPDLARVTFSGFETSVDGTSFYSEKTSNKAPPSLQSKV